MERLEAIISNFYEAAAGQKDWSSVLAELSAATGSHGSLLISTTHRGRLLGFSDSEAESAEAYLAGNWHLLDERYRGVPIMRAQGVAVDHDFFSDEDIAKSQYYQDFIIKRGIPWWAGLHVPTDKETWCLTSLRTSLQGPYGLPDKNLLLRFAPHLSRALILHRAVQKTRTDAMLSILEEMSTASIALAANGKVLAFNALADKILGDGLIITNDHLHAVDTVDDLRLQEFISAGIARHPYVEQVPPAVPIKRAGKRQFAVRMISLSDKLRSAFGRLAAIILITDPHSGVASDATLRAFFNLTPAEARLARYLADGASVRESAENLAIEESTARQYVKQILAKSETHRQSEFVALATRLLHPVIRRDR